MDDDRLTLSPDYSPDAAKAPRRWEKLDARLDRAARDPHYDPYRDRDPRRRPGFRLTMPVLILVAAIVFCAAFAGAPLLAFRAVRSAAQFGDVQALARSEERRVGKECLRLCRSRWSPYH